MMLPPLVYPPWVVVLKDGTRILPEVEEPNEALPKPHMGKLRRRVIERAVAEIQVLSTVSLGGFGVVRTDQGTTVVQLVDDEASGNYLSSDNEASVRLNAYGLGRGESESGGARRVLGFMVESLLEGPRNGEYSPRWLRITPAADPLSWRSPKISLGQAALEWPGPPLLKFFPAPDRARGRSIGVGGSLMQEIASALGDRPTLSTWTDGTTTMDLFVTILYPGEFEDYRPAVMIDNWGDFGLPGGAGWTR